MSKNNMKILLVNDIPTHHQYHLAASLYDLLGNNFRFACFNPVSVERIRQGWKDIGNDTSWVLRTWENNKIKEEYQAWYDESDVVIGIPHGDWLSLRNRVLKNKLCLPTSERIWKPSNTKLKNNSLIDIVKFYKLVFYYAHRLHLINNNSCHLLTIGTYTAWDFHQLRVFSNRMWNYGYFVPVPVDLVKSKNGNEARILWAGRMIDWKKVHILLYALAKLKQKNKKFTLTLIGDGPEKESIVHQCKKLGLSDDVFFYPSTTPEGIREAMRNSHIYVLPSSYQEGWGVVINEAMSEGCAVIASNGAGATNMLIQHGENGYIFSEGDYKELSEYLEFLVTNVEKANEIGRKAWQSIKKSWSPEVAATRLVLLSKSLLENTTVPDLLEGPCSRAKIVRPNG